MKFADLIFYKDSTKLAKSSENLLSFSINFINFINLFFRILLDNY